jgi:hypothetical protein
LELKGLILPTEFMCPQDGESFFTFVPWVKTLQSLKIRMPFLTADRGRTYMRTFWRRVERMKELRELWLADGLGTWREQPGQPGRYIEEWYPTETELRRHSTMFANKCPKLTYLRILDRAWWITRTGAGKGGIRLQEVGRECLEKDIPEAFDFGPPKVI